MAHPYSGLISDQTNIPQKAVDATLRLLDDGATIPFISRYRKEATGSLDEVAIHSIFTKYENLKTLDKRKASIIESIDQQGKLTPELKKRINETLDSSVLEDIYLPYKPKRRTRAQIAIEQGVEPLAKMIMAQSLDEIDKVAKKYVGKELTLDDVKQGASDIIAEWVNENEKARSIVRSRYLRNAILLSKVAKGKETEGRTYENYFDYEVPLRSCASHRLLAMLRGEKEGFLKLTVSIDDNEAVERLSRLFIRSSVTDTVAAFIKNAIKDSYRRLIKPSIITEVLGIAKDKADEGAIAMFADNLRQLLLASPLGPKCVLAVDPGYRTGCKVVCLDSKGDLMCHDVIYPNPPQNDFHGSSFKICRMVDDFGIEAIAVGNGTASRETEAFLSSLRYSHPVDVFVVNESGASIYSASAIAREEFPDEDVTVRGAVSIGRRLIDPLAELVKIDPKSIGVGQYQHDVDQVALKESLNYTVESCVNSVGINVNTASKELLSYVSGIGPSLAANIVRYRTENGAFRKRQELMDVPRMGEKAFQQCAGFLRIPGGENVLDNTGVHPERYELLNRIIEDNNITLDILLKNPAMMMQLDLTPYMDKSVGIPTFKDIMDELEKPGRDPRSVAESTEFDNAVKNIKDLVPGMLLNGVVNNITAFGCFVDIGLHENGLVHISQLTDRFISSPSEVVSINQQVKVKVLDVDYARGRISLTMKGF